MSQHEGRTHRLSRAGMDHGQEVGKQVEGYKTRGRKGGTEPSPSPAENNQVFKSRRFRQVCENGVPRSSDLPVPAQATTVVNEPGFHPSSPDVLQRLVSVIVAMALFPASDEDGWAGGTSSLLLANFLTLVSANIGVSDQFVIVIAQHRWSSACQRSVDAERKSHQASIASDVSCQLAGDLVRAIRSAVSGRTGSCSQRPVRGQRCSRDASTFDVTWRILCVRVCEQWCL